MATDTLVTERIDLGLELLTLLVNSGFDVIAACWIKAGEEGRWFLYIASEEVDRSGLSAAYRKVYASFKSTPDQDWDWINSVKLIGKDNPITKDILEIRERFPASIATRSRYLQLGSIPSEEVYIYPEIGAGPVSPRLSYRVNYQRQGKADRWRASTERGPIYRGMTAKGAVAYSTAQWAGEKEGDEDFATVSVLLEVDPYFDVANKFIHPELWRVLDTQAREMSDRMFKSRHPGAAIEHIQAD